VGRVEHPPVPEETARKAAEFYRRHRFAIVWTESRNGDKTTKRFTGKGWQETGPLEDVEDFVKRLRFANPGINLRGSRFVGVEIDGKEQLERFNALGVAAAGMVAQSSTPDRLHFFYRWPRDLETNEPVSFRFEGDGVVAANTNAYVCPPGTHPSGERKWLKTDGLAALSVGDYDRMRAAAGRSKTAQRVALKRGEKVADGARHNYLVSEVGRLRKQGYAEQDALATLLGLDTLNCEPPVGDGDELRSMVADIYRKDPLPQPAEWDGNLTLLLNDTYKLLRRYFVIGTAETVFLTLWIAHTYVIDQCFLTPYGSIESPTKRCGKTNLLLLSSWLCAGGWFVINPSTASLYQKFDQGDVALCLDEIDTLYTAKGASEAVETLRAVFNAGFMRGATVPRGRKEGGKNGPDEFDVFCPKLFAGIGKSVPEKVRDRSVPLRMQRKTRKENVVRFRMRRARTEAHELAARFRAWAASGPVLKDLDDDRLPPELDDRAQDIWEPVLAVADLEAGEWVRQARLAAIELSGGRDGIEDDASLGVLLLGDTREILTYDRIRTLDLITVLCTDDKERPWREWWWDEREGKPKGGAPHRLGRLLRQFEIHSKLIRFDEGPARGYERADFEGAWTRYLPSTPQKALQPLHRPIQAKNSPKRSVTTTTL
jgi:Protein of unknown function (DUF3631)/Bifunctional DNA primase/polymerase, N-terminal